MVGASGGLLGVDGTTVQILDNAVVNRNMTASHFADLYRTLQQAINTTLAQQEGRTADAIRDALRQDAELGRCGFRSELP